VGEWGPFARAHDAFLLHAQCLNFRDVTGIDSMCLGSGRPDG
jgi:hypothetical protein